MRGTERDGYGRRAVAVSVDDVARVVSRAFHDRSGRIRLTAGQRRAILSLPRHPGPVRA